MKKEALRVSTTIPAAPTTVYLAWLSAEQHSAMTGLAAKIDSTVGAKFSAANGYVSGKLVILDLGRRIVVSWRSEDFPPDAPDSRVEIHFEALGGSTRLTVLHTDIPEGQSEKYRSHWNDAYFNPMRTFFSKYLPDPRKPPPPRRPIPPEDDEEETAPPAKKGKAAPVPAKGKAPPPPPPPSKKAAPPAKPAKPEKPAKREPTKPAKAAKPAKPTKPAKPAQKKPAKPAKPAKKKPAKAGKKKS